MPKKILFVGLTWFLVALAVFGLYLLREVSPMREFILWALSVWPILTLFGAGAIIISGWIIKHDFSKLSFRIIGSAEVDREDKRGARFIVPMIIMKRIPRFVSITSVRAFLGNTAYDLQKPWTQPPPNEEVEERVGFGYADSKRNYDGLTLRVVMEYLGQRVEHACLITDTLTGNSVKPSLEVMPVKDLDTYYLQLQNVGGSGTFEAQVSVLAGLNHLREKRNRYIARWENEDGKRANILSGQVGRIKIARLVHELGSEYPRMDLYLYSQDNAEETYVSSYEYGLRKLRFPVSSTPVIEILTRASVSWIASQNFF